MTINEIQDEVIEEFLEIDDWMDRYQLLIDLGEEQEPLPAAEKIEKNLIDGCQSRVWIVCDEVLPVTSAPSPSSPAPSPSAPAPSSSAPAPNSSKLCSATGCGKAPILRFRAESDALIVKGIVSLVIRVLSGHTPQEILDADLYFIEKIGLTEHLSPTRSNGLLAMIKQIRMYALAVQAAHKA